VAITNYTTPGEQGTATVAMAATAETLRQTLRNDHSTNKVMFEVRVLTPATLTTISVTIPPFSPGSESATDTSDLESSLALAQANLATAMAFGTDLEEITYRAQIDVITSQIASRRQAARVTPPAIELNPPAVDNGSYSFYGRIEMLDDDVFPSPHALLEDPCNITIHTHPTLALQLIQCHTQFISKTGYDGPVPRVGDRVQVILDKSDLGYNLQYCYFEEITDITMREIENELQEKECDTLLTIFDHWDGSTDMSTYSSELGASQLAQIDSRSTERNARIDRIFAAASRFLPVGTRVTSRGRTVGYGSNMIIRMARDPDPGGTLPPVPTPAGDAPRSDVTRFPIAEVNRIRGILTSSPYNKAIADPRRSNHCVGPGCEGSSGTKIAFDVSGAPISTISAGFSRFKTDLGPEGYPALLANGTLQEEFVTSGFVAPDGWKMEPANGAVHVEVTPRPGSEIMRGSLLATVGSATAEEEATTAAAADTAAAAENPAPTQVPAHPGLVGTGGSVWFEMGWTYSDSAGRTFSDWDSFLEANNAPGWYDVDPEWIRYTQGDFVFESPGQGEPFEPVEE